MNLAFVIKLIAQGVVVVNTDYGRNVRLTVQQSQYQLMYTGRGRLFVVDCINIVHGAEDKMKLVGFSFDNVDDEDGVSTEDLSPKFFSVYKLTPM